MKESSDIERDLKNSVGDYLHTIVKAGASAIPVVGGPAAEVFSLLIAPPLSKRRDKWLIKIHEGLLELKEKVDGFSIESLVQNEFFTTLLLTTTQIAIKTHQEEKLETLRNVVLNSISSSLEEDRQLWFLSIVDTLTATHIKLLKFFDREFDWNDGNGGFYSFNTLVNKLISENFPESKDNMSFYQQIVEDLVSKGFLNNKNRDEGLLRHDKGIAGIITSLGVQLLDFITPPEKRPVRKSKGRLVISGGGQYFA